SLEETVQILHGLNDRYEAHHRVTITDEAIRAAAELSNRYITDRFLPDKAIDLIDESGSKVRLRSYTIPPKLKEVEKEVEEEKKGNDYGVLSQECEKDAAYRDQEKKLRQKLETTNNKWKEEQGQEDLSVTEEDIAAVVPPWPGIPVVKLTKDE